MHPAPRILASPLAVADNSDHWRKTDAVLESVRSQIEASDLVVVLESPQPGLLRVGHGLALAVRGVCAHRSQKIQRISVCIGDHVTSVKTGRVRDEIAPVLAEGAFKHPSTSGFYGSAVIPSTSVGSSVELKLEVELSDGSTHARSLGHVDIEDGGRTPKHTGLPGGEEPYIVVAMAAFEPDPDGFRRQLESIRNQTLESWHLLIRDDASSDASLDMMRDAIGEDRRITLVEGQRNLGFYANFEQTLRLVPEWAQFIALADQDDDWGPDKLERLVAAFGQDEDVTLVYSDMRIVDANGNVISETYWRGRNNNYTDLDVMMLANTVTGAASMFRSDLLDPLLPFPDRIGDAFHDHWIALTAMIRGSIRYVDAPLYDYIQHDQAVIGHADFETPPLSARVARVLRAPLKKSFWTSLKHRFVAGRQAALNIHRYECRRLELISDTLIARYPSISTRALRSLNVYGRGFSSALTLLAKHVKVVLGRHSTNDAEIRLGLGYLAYAIDPLVLKIRGSSQDRGAT